MRYLIIALLLQFLVIAQSAQGYAGVAEASTAPDHHSNLQYDFSGFSEYERKWFTTFIQGNILAEGWGQITSDILQHASYNERENQEQLLNQLGAKIGREWCRTNDVRRIDTSMLRKWGSELRKTARNEPQQLVEVIKYIDDEVDSLLD